jgi:hypothetical protein
MVRAWVRLGHPETSSPTRWDEHCTGDHKCHNYVLPEALLHPAVVDQARELARLLSAYGVVPTEPQLVAPQAGDTTEKLERP